MTNEQVALLAAAYARVRGKAIVEIAEEFLTWLDSRTIRQDSVTNRPESPG